MSSSHDSEQDFSLSTLASKGYPQEAKLLLDALFGEFTNCYIEIRLLGKGMSPIQLFYPSMSKIQWDLIKSKNSEGYNCYFGVGLLYIRHSRGPKMIFIPSLFNYLVSRVSPKATHTIGRNRKADILFKDGIRSWNKRLMKNINRPHIEIYGVKRITRYTGYSTCSCFIEIPILHSARYEGIECDTSLINDKVKR